MSHHTISDVQKRINESNIISFTRNQNRYIIQEQATLSELWERVPCTCDEGCTCRKFGCTHHWKIKEGLSFNDILPGFLRMFVSNTRHRYLLSCLEQPSYPASLYSDEYLKGAYDVLAWYRDTWDEIYPNAAEYTKTLICDGWVSPYWSERWRFPIGSPIYKSKMMSLLLPDLAVPFDTASLNAMIKSLNLAYGDSYITLLSTIHHYCTKLLENERISLEEFRRLDIPGEAGTFDKDLVALPIPNRDYGCAFAPPERPLSRVIDKIFYKPE